MNHRQAPPSWARDTGSVLASPKPEEGNDSNSAHPLKLLVYTESPQLKKKTVQSFAKQKYGEQTK